VCQGGVGINKYSSYNSRRPNRGTFTSLLYSIPREHTKRRNMFSIRLQEGEIESEVTAKQHYPCL